MPLHLKTTLLPVPAPSGGELSPFMRRVVANALFPTRPSLGFFASEIMIEAGAESTPGGAIGEKIYCYPVEIHQGSGGTGSRITPRPLEVEDLEGFLAFAAAVGGGDLAQEVADRIASLLAAPLYRHAPVTLIQLRPGAAPGMSPEAVSAPSVDVKLYHNFEGVRAESPGFTGTRAAMAVDRLYPEFRKLYGVTLQEIHEELGIASVPLDLIGLRLPMAAGVPSAEFYLGGPTAHFAAAENRESTAFVAAMEEVGYRLVQYGIEPAGSDRSGRVLTLFFSPEERIETIDADGLMQALGSGSCAGLAQLLASVPGARPSEITRRIGPDGEVVMHVGVQLGVEGVEHFAP